MQSANNSAVEHVRRAVIRHISRARKALRQPSFDDDAVHDARKDLKRARSGLRLLRPLDEAGYQRENMRLRNAARRLSAVRDEQDSARAPGAAVCRGEETRTPAAPPRAAQGIAQRAAPPLARAALGRAQDYIEEVLATAARRVRNWRTPPDADAAPKLAVRRLYRQGRKALAALAQGPDRRAAARSAQEGQAPRAGARDTWGRGTAEEGEESSQARGRCRRPARRRPRLRGGRGAAPCPAGRRRESEEEAARPARKRSARGCRRKRWRRRTSCSARRRGASCAAPPKPPEAPRPFRSARSTGAAAARQRARPLRPAGLAAASVREVVGDEEVLDLRDALRDPRPRCHAPQACSPRSAAPRATGRYGSSFPSRSAGR